MFRGKCGVERLAALLASGARPYSDELGDGRHAVAEPSGGTVVQPAPGAYGRKDDVAEALRSRIRAAILEQARAAHRQLTCTVQVPLIVALAS